jgi:hypothetical protein
MRFAMGTSTMLKVDKKTKVIIKYTITDASVQDSQELKNLVEMEER